MKTIHEIKQFIKSKFGIAVVGNTGTGKSKWQSIRIRPDPITDFRAALVYKCEFPVLLRQACLKIVYPESESLQQQTQGGNIQSHSIAMLAHQWDNLIDNWPASTPQVVCTNA